MQSEGSVGSRHDSAVDGVQQSGGIRSLQVGNLEANRVLGIDVDAVAHGILGPVRIAAVHGCEISNPGHGVVEHLLAEVTGEIGASRLDRVGRPDVGPRRHGQDVGGLRHEETCRSGPCAAGVNEGDHGHLGVQKAGDDVVHRGRDAARGVDHDQEGIRVVGLGSRHRGGHVGGHDRVDVAVEVGLLNARHGRGRRRRGQKC